MPATTTLGAIRTNVRRRANMENSQFCTDAELDSYINAGYYELYDLLIQKYGDDYYVATAVTFTTDGTNDKYALQADFYKLLGVDLALSGTANSYVTLKPFRFGDRNRYAVPNFQSFYGVTNLRYRLLGSNLWLTPLPASGQKVRVWYAPRLTALSADGDVVDGISGWEEYLVVDAAIRALQKEESDVSVLMAQKQGLIARIEAAAENRDAGSVPTVLDSQWSDFGWPNGNGSGGGGMF